MSKATHDNDTTRYRCPLDGSPLNPYVDPGWWCPHDNHQSSEHQTILAYDTERDCVIRQLGNGQVPVIDEKGDETDWSKACPNGHRNIRNVVDGGYYCRSCNDTFDGGPIDVAAVNKP